MCHSDVLFNRQDGVHIYIYSISAPLLVYKGHSSRSICCTYNGALFPKQFSVFIFIYIYIDVCDHIWVQCELFARCQAPKSPEDPFWKDLGGKSYLLIHICTYIYIYK